MTSVNYEITGQENVDGQMLLLSQFPVLADAHFRPGMVEAIDTLYGSVEPLIPTLTGHAKETFSKKVTGKGMYLTGRVGWWGADWYMNVVEYGAKAHLILPRDSGGWLAFIPNGGQQNIFTRAIHHTGFVARHFMKRGFEAARPVMSALFGKAGEDMVNALVFKPHRTGGGRARYNRK